MSLIGGTKEMRAKLKMLLALCLFSSNVYANHNYTTYYIDYSYDDKFFIISGSKFEAQLYCFNMMVGDPVVFLEGNVYGACVIAKILNLRTKQDCQVWCEY